MEQVTSPEREAFRDFLLEQALDYTHLSNCLDRQLGALLVKDGKIIGRGANLCAPSPKDDQGYGDVLLFCPRLNSKRGTHRKKCRGFHAEVFACLSATDKGITPKDYARFAWHQFDGEKRGVRTRCALQRRFSTADRERLRGAELYLVGVAYVCDACQELLNSLGVIIHKENVVRYRHITPDEIVRQDEIARLARIKSAKS